MGWRGACVEDGVALLGVVDDAGDCCEAGVDCVLRLPNIVTCSNQ